MAKKVSRIISAGILALAVFAVLMVLRPSNAPLVPATAEDANAFDEKIASLMQAHEQSTQGSAHITEAELTSKLQQGLDEIPPSPGAVVLRAASVHLENDGFVGVFTLSVYGKALYLTMTGSLGVLDGRPQIEPSSAKLGSLPIPPMVFRRILQRQFDTPESWERLRLPEIIKDVHIENSKLVVEGQ